MTTISKIARIISLICIFLFPGYAYCLPQTFIEDATLVNPSARGLVALEFAPDGKLWAFAGPSDSLVTSATVFNPSDGIFFNGNDTASTVIGAMGQGNFFDNSGRLISFTNGASFAQARSANNGIFFDGDDTVSTVGWQFAGGIRGTSEPVFAAMGPDGLVYSTAYNLSQTTSIGVFNPVTNSYNEFSLPSLGNFSAWGITFDSNGNLYLSDPQRVSLTLIGIDSHDGIFFNGDDIQKSYHITSARFTDIAFGPDGRLYAFDVNAPTQRMAAYLPNGTATDSYAVPEPASLVLLLIGLLSLITMHFRMREQRVSA